MSSSGFVRQRIAFASCGVCGLSCDRTGISTATGIGASRLPVTMRRMHVLPNALGLRGRHSPSSSGRRPAAAICRGACSPPTATGRSWPCSWAFKSLAPSPWLLPRPPDRASASASAGGRWSLEARAARDLHVPTQVLLPHTVLLARFHSRASRSATYSCRSAGDMRVCILSVTRDSRRARP